MIRSQKNCDKDTQALKVLEIGTDEQYGIFLQQSARSLPISKLVVDQPPIRNEKEIERLHSIIKEHINKKIDERSEYKNAIAALKKSGQPISFNQKNTTIIKVYEQELNNIITPTLMNGVFEQCLPKEGSYGRKERTMKKSTNNLHDRYPPMPTPEGVIESRDENGDTICTISFNEASGKENTEPTYWNRLTSWVSPSQQIKSPLDDNQHGAIEDIQDTVSYGKFVIEDLESDNEIDQKNSPPISPLAEELVKQYCNNSSTPMKEEKDFSEIDAIAHSKKRKPDNRIAKTLFPEHKSNEVSATPITHSTSPVSSAHLTSPVPSTHSTSPVPSNHTVSPAPRPNYAPVVPRVQERENLTLSSTHFAIIICAPIAVVLMASIGSSLGLSLLANSLGILCAAAFSISLWNSTPYKGASQIQYDRSSEQAQALLPNSAPAPQNRANSHRNSQQFANTAVTANSR